MPANQAVAHRLLQQLAELGDGDCQTDLGFALAMGLEPLGPNSRDQLFRFVPPDIPAALVHYYFGAASGDSVAQVILGYRHLQVKQACKAWGTGVTPRIRVGRSMQVVLGYRHLEVGAQRAGQEVPPQLQGGLDGTGLGGRKGRVAVERGCSLRLGVWERMCCLCARFDGVCMLLHLVGHRQSACCVCLAARSLAVRTTAAKLAAAWHA